MQIALGSTTESLGREVHAVATLGSSVLVAVDSGVLAFDMRADAGTAGQPSLCIPTTSPCYDVAVGAGGRIALVERSGLLQIFTVGPEKGLLVSRLLTTFTANRQLNTVTWRERVVATVCEARVWCRGHCRCSAQGL